MRESRTSGSVRGDRGNPVPYRYTAVTIPFIKWNQKLLPSFIDLSTFRNTGPIFPCVVAGAFRQMLDSILVGSRLIIVGCCAFAPEWVAEKPTSFLSVIAAACGESEQAKQS